jgi:hypothetical protein
MVASLMRSSSGSADGWGYQRVAGARHNEALQRTKPAFFLDCAGFAAERRCCAD